MAGVNKVMLIGRLGSDPETRYAQSGKAVTKFRVATDSGWGDNKTTDWHQVVTFDKTAENCARFLSKGRQVYIEGRISYRKWDKEDGTSTWYTDIIAREVQFLGERGGSGGGGGYQGGGGGGGYQGGGGGGGYQGGGGGGGYQGGGGGGGYQGGGGGGGYQGGGSSGGGGYQGGGGGGGDDFGGGGGGFDEGFADSDIPF